MDRPDLHRIPVGRGVGWSAVFLAVTRNLMNMNLAAIALLSVIGGVIYLAVFLMLAIDRTERLWYLTKALQLIKRPRHAAAM